MISYIDFVKTLDKLEELDMACDKIREAFNLLDKDNMSFFSLGWTIEIIVNLLKIASNDKYDNISYWLYDLNRGEHGKNCITERNGKKTSLITPKQLYAYILKNQK
jgi:hypothetical protein